MSDDEWVKVATSDDALVVQLLLELNRADGKSPPRPPLKWTVRQRRSKQLLRRKKSARASPTTPLSWSGGTSGNGRGAAAADGFEESSSLPTRGAGQTLRSKVAATNGTPTSKRSRKKKTLAELKEEESLLSNERRNLKNQLARLRLYLEQQRTANERLKRMKLDLLSRHMPDDVMVPAKYEEANFDSLQKIKGASDPKISVSTPSITIETAATNLSFQTEEVEVRMPSFLPDLNLPVEDDLGRDFLYGLS